MVTETPNLKLKKPAGTDLVDISQLNANADILDTEVAGKLDKSGGTLTGPITIHGGDGQGILMPTDGNINVAGTTNTVLGFYGSQFMVGNGSYPTNIRGSGARPQFNGSDVAMKSDVPSIAGLATEAYVNEKVTSVYRVMGSCATADLASKAKTKGDVWNLTDAGSYGPIGTNVVYNGTEWDALGGTYDLSSKANQSDLNALAGRVQALENIPNARGVNF